MTIDQKSGSEWVCECPICGRMKLAIHVGRRAVQCLSAHCGFATWRPRYLVAAVLNIRWDAADDLIESFALGRALGEIAPLGTVQSFRRSASELPSAPLPRCSWGLGPAQLNYLESRKVPIDHARLLGLGTVLSDRTGSKADRLLTGRVIFPIWAPSGRVVFWLARSIWADSKAKVVNLPRACREHHGSQCACYHESWGLPPVPESAEAHEVVIGLHLVTPGRPVVIVEGPTDVAVCGPGFVGTLGAHLSDDQAMLIASSGASEAIILFDGDEGGAKAAPKAAKLLGSAIPTRWAICPPGTDPGSLGREQALKAAFSASSQSLMSLSAPAQNFLPKTQVKPPFLRKLKNE